MLSYPIVAFHVNDQRRPLSKCFWTEAALELLDVKMYLPMALESLRVQETFAAALPVALVRPLGFMCGLVLLEVASVLESSLTGLALVRFVLAVSLQVTPQS